MTLTTIGYGDVVAATKGEMLVACFGMALGASIYAYIVGGICGILANRDPVSLEFNQTLDNLNNLMSEYKIPRAMKENLREFHFKTQSLFRARMHQTVLEVLSPELRNQVVAFINYKWISKVRLFKSLPADERGNFMTRVTMAMTAQVHYTLRSCTLSLSRTHTPRVHASRTLFSCTPLIHRLFIRYSSRHTVRVSILCGCRT
jgi:hypothetical protein